VKAQALLSISWMRLVINGEERFFAEGEAITAETLGGVLGLKGVYAIEVNRTIVRRENRPGLLLKDGDVIEIVQFVGGG
jgi:thiamine biosynthesis protein ThiS